MAGVLRHRTSHVAPRADRVARLRRGLPVRRRLSMCPVPGGDAEPGDPMHPPTALGAVEDEFPEASLEVGLHLQELEPQHLRVDGDGVGAVEAGRTTGRLLGRLFR
jgi:hypothetical protein